MAEYCRTMFGDMLLTEPLEKFPVSRLHCGASGAEGCGPSAGCQDAEAHLGGLLGPTVYHMSDTMLGLRDMLVAKGPVPALRLLTL